jgi:hypothetical protein
MTKLTLYLWWESRDPWRDEDARKLARFVSRLPDFDPIYRSWLDSPDGQEQTVPVPLSEAEAKQLLIDRMEYHDVVRPDVPPVPWPELGCSFWGGHAGPPPYDFREASYADTRCNIGAYGRRGSPRPNTIFMRLSEIRPSTGKPWRASELRPLMRFAREIWNPAEMCAMPSFCRPPKTPDPTWAAGERTLEPRIGWITFLPADLAARAKYPADVAVEPLADGAVLVTLCEEPFDETDSEELARFRALEAALRPIQR